jgi:hypothetical protein
VAYIEPQAVAIAILKAILKGFLSDFDGWAGTYDPRAVSV